VSKDRFMGIIQFESAVTEILRALLRRGFRKRKKKSCLRESQARLHRGNKISTGRKRKRTFFGKGIKMDMIYRMCQNILENLKSL
jgi:hypothetical protein